MVLTIWDTLRHFKKTENWGDPEKINPALLVILDKLRTYTGMPITINNGYSNGTGHVNNSQHYLGNAVDFHFSSAKSLREQYGKLYTFLDKIDMLNKVGLGVYPDWNTPGFHLDVRGHKARWIRIKGEYVGLNLTLLP